MNCADCPHRKPTDAVDEMEFGVQWVCSLPHSQCEDMTCLLRMIIWQLANIEDLLTEE
jgi:hypothetical protein